MRFVMLILFWLSTVGSGLAQDGWFMPARLEKPLAPSGVYRTPGEPEDLEEVIGKSHTEYNPGGDDRNLKPSQPVYAWRMFTAKSGRDYEIQVRPLIQLGS